MKSPMMKMLAMSYSYLSPLVWSWFIKINKTIYLIYLILREKLGKGLLLLPYPLGLLWIVWVVVTKIFLSWLCSIPFSSSLLDIECKLSWVPDLRLNLSHMPVTSGLNVGKQEHMIATFVSMDVHNASGWSPQLLNSPSGAKAIATTRRVDATQTLSLLVSIKKVPYLRDASQIK